MGTLDLPDKSHIRQWGKFPACRFRTRHGGNRKLEAYSNDFVGRVTLDRLKRNERPSPICPQQVARQWSLTANQIHSGLW